MHMKHGLWLSIMMLISGLAQSATQSIEGTWRTIDDKSGFAKAIAEVKQESDGSYSATIIRVIPRPNYTPKTFCQNCPAPYTNKPILGLKILSGLKADPKREQTYTGGSILDPLNGKLYSAKARLSTDGRRLSIRGYLGISMLGRTPIWIRDGSEIDADGLGRMPTAEK